MCFKSDTVFVGDTVRGDFKLHPVDHLHVPSSDGRAIYGSSLTGQNWDRFYDLISGLVNHATEKARQVRSLLSSTSQGRAH